MERSIKPLTVILCILFFSLASCGSGSGGGDGGGGSNADKMTISVNGGAEKTYSEKAVGGEQGFDPVIWSRTVAATTQILLQSGYNSSNEPWDIMVMLMIDHLTTGTFTLADVISISYYEYDKVYIASNGNALTSATITITRHDEKRIIGTFNAVLESQQNPGTTITFTGGFDFEPGIMN